MCKTHKKLPKSLTLVMQLHAMLSRRKQSSLLPFSPQLLNCFTQLHFPQDLASMPSGGRVSTLPLLTSFQFVLSEVPLLSV
jgi:hypothetical protein